MWKKSVKRLLFRFAPRVATALISARARAHSQRMFRQWGLMDLNEKLIRALGLTVQSGPFAGMCLTPTTFREHLGPYLLGTYEAELHSVLCRVKEGLPTQIVDVGSKFGYYAIGLARHFPAVQVVAFDTDWWARKATREMAKANQTRNVEVRSFCSPEWLQVHLKAGSFVISDCEGYEGELFTATVPNFSSTTLLIEVHDMWVPGVSSVLIDRFAATHDFAIVKNAPHVVPEIDLSFLSPDAIKQAIQEIRPPQQWLYFTPKAQ